MIICSADGAELTPTLLGSAANLDTSVLVRAVSDLLSDGVALLLLKHDMIPCVPQLLRCKNTTQNSTLSTHQFCDTVILCSNMVADPTVRPHRRRWLRVRVTDAMCPYRTDRVQERKISWV